MDATDRLLLCLDQQSKDLERKNKNKNDDIRQKIYLVSAIKRSQGADSLYRGLAAGSTKTSTAPNGLAA